MSEKIKRLGDAELEIMLVIWGSSVPVTSNYIHEHLKKSRNWALSTLMTTLERLVQKGFIYCDRSTRTNYYSAVIAEQSYKVHVGRSLLERLFGDSVQNLVTSLYDSKNMTNEDIHTLKEYLDELERKGDK